MEKTDGPASTGPGKGKGKAPKHPPSSIYVTCPDCDEEVLHHVLKGKMVERGTRNTLDATVQCSKCHRVHHLMMGWDKPIMVRMVVSHHEKSTPSSIELPTDEMLAIGDEFENMGSIVKVTAIDSDGRRVGKAKVGDIDTLWVKAFDELRLKFSIYEGRISKTAWIVAEPDDVVVVGDEMDIAGKRVKIMTIRTTERTLRRGEAEVRDIVRVYAKTITERGLRQSRRERWRTEMVKGGWKRKTEEKGKGRGGTQGRT